MSVSCDNPAEKDGASNAILSAFICGARPLISSFKRAFDRAQYTRKKDDLLAQSISASSRSRVTSYLMYIHVLVIELEEQRETTVYAARCCSATATYVYSIVSSACMCVYATTTYSQHQNFWSSPMDAYTHAWLRWGEVRIKLRYWGERRKKQILNEHKTAL